MYQKSSLILENSIYSSAGLDAWSRYAWYYWRDAYSRFMVWISTRITVLHMKYCAAHHVMKNEMSNIAIIDWNQEGEVCLSGFSDVAHAITTPQARTFRLGRTPHAPRRMPKGVNGRNIWMLSLSQKGAGGDGTHEALRKSMEDHVIGADALKRQKDSVAQFIVHQLLVDYKATTRVIGKKNKKIVTNAKFYTDNWLVFWTKYMHYCLFGINPLDETKISVMRNFFYNRNRPLAVLYHAMLIGPLVGLLKQALPRALRTLQKSTRNHRHSPRSSKHRKKSNSKAWVGKGHGPSYGQRRYSWTDDSCRYCFGISTPSEHQFAKNKKIDVTKVWDTKIDLNSKTDVEQYIYECGRLAQPVSATHRVATEPFTVKIGGRDRTFPTGLSMVNEDFWGDTLTNSIIKGKTCVHTAWSFILLARQPMAEFVLVNIWQWIWSLILSWGWVRSAANYSTEIWMKGIINDLHTTSVGVFDWHTSLPLS